MPKVTVQCEAEISPKQLAAMIWAMDRDDLNEFWCGTTHAMRYASDEKVEHMGVLGERLSQVADAVQAERLALSLKRPI